MRNLGVFFDLRLKQTVGQISEMLVICDPHHAHHDVTVIKCEKMKIYVDVS